MSNSSTQLLSALLLDLAEAERKLEVLRVVLAQLPDFNPFSFFRLLDHHGAGSLTASELSEFFRSNNFSPLDEDIVRFVKALDSDSDGRLSFSDLMAALLPRADEDLRRFVLSKPQCSDVRLSLDTQIAVSRLLQTYVESIRVIELSKLALASAPHFNLLDTFRLIDTENEASVTAQQFIPFFQSVGIYDNQQNVEAIMRVLDTDGDGKVSYLEFIDGVLPGELKYRAAVKGVGEYLTPTKKARSTPRRRPNSTQSRSTVRSHQLAQSASARRTPLRSSARRRQHSRKPSTLFESPPRVRRVLFAPGSNLPELADVFLAQLKADTLVEATRETLALRLDFTVDALFSTFDQSEKGYVPVRLLSSRLKKYRLALENDQLSLLVKALDRDRDKKVLIQDFADVVTPRGKEYRTVLRERDESCRKKFDTSMFSLETSDLICQLFRKIIENETTNEELRQEIVHNDLFSLSKAAQILDCRSKGFLTASDFRSFLRRHGKCPTEGELETLMARYDWDRDGRVTYEDFVTELTPKVPRVGAISR